MSALKQQGGSCPDVKYAPFLFQGCSACKNNTALLLLPLEFNDGPEPSNKGGGELLLKVSPIIVRLSAGVGRAPIRELTGGPGCPTCPLLSVCSLPASAWGSLHPHGEPQPRTMVLVGNHPSALAASGGLTRDESTGLTPSGITWGCGRGALLSQAASLSCSHVHTLASVLPDLLPK